MQLTKYILLKFAPIMPALIFALLLIMTSYYSNNYACVRACVCVCVYAIIVCVCVYVYVYVCVCMSVHVCVSVCVSKQVYICNK